MLMLAAAAVVVWQAGSTVDMARCRTVRAGQIGPEARWETDGKNRLWVSTTARASGRIELQCRIPIVAAAGLMLELESAAVSFAGAESRDPGSGLTVVLSGVHWELLRVAGEDWVEAAGRRTPVTPNSSHLVLTIAALDRSTRDPMRIDLRGLRLVRVSTEESRSSLPTARVP
jgi:hypothetical protein